MTTTTLFYRAQSFQMLPNPRNIPFHIQGMPLPDPLQQHFTRVQGDVISSGYQTANDLATDRFLGTVWKQTNEPKYLGANERIVFESSW
jgi:hypothetical protein